jgi:hypothetical protein
MSEHTEPTPDEDVEIDETFSDPDAPDADPGFTPDPDLDIEDEDDGEPIVDDDVAEFLVGEDEDPADVLAIPEAERNLAAARNLDGYSGATYDLVDEDGNVLDTFRADVQFGVELADGQSLVPSSV